MSRFCYWGWTKWHKHQIEFYSNKADYDLIVLHGIMWLYFAGLSKNSLLVFNTVLSERCGSRPLVSVSLTGTDTSLVVSVLVYLYPYHCLYNIDMRIKNVQLWQTRYIITKEYLFYCLSIEAYSQSVNYLFIFLIVSFEDQKFKFWWNIISWLFP